MCVDPVSLTSFASFLGANSGTLSAVSAGVGAVGAYQSSAAAKAGAQYQAAVATNNAKVEEWKAQDAENRADLDAQALGRKIASVRGQQKATMGANGVDMSFGSAQATLDQTDFYGLEDQKTTIDNGNKEAWAARTRAANYKTDAAWASSRAKSENPLLAGGLSLLGSAGNIAEKWAVKNPSSSGRSWHAGA